MLWTLDSALRSYIIARGCSNRALRSARASGWCRARLGEVLVSGMGLYLTRFKGVMLVSLVALDVVSTNFLNFKLLPGGRVAFFSKCAR